MIGFVGAWGGAAAPVRAGAAASAFAGSRLAVTPVTRMSYVEGGRRASLQMSVFDRFFRVVRSNVNSAVNAIEDPEKVIEQTVADMGNDLAKLRQAYAEIAATQKRLERQKQQAETTAEEWYKRAQLAVSKGDDELATEALLRKKQQDEISASFGTQLDAMAENTTKLYESMKQLEAKIAEARLKKDQFVARARTAKTSQKVNEMLSNTQTSGAMESFERMKDKVEAMETKAEVTQELAAGTTGKDPSLESRFKELESGSGAVSDELAALKNQMGASKPTNLLPANPVVNAELEKMKKEQGL